MISPAPKIDPIWTEALNRALLICEERDDLLLFREQREDLAVVLDSGDGRLSTTHNWTGGVSASLSGDGRTCHSSEAAPDAVESLVRVVLGERELIPAPSMTGVEPSEARFRAGDAARLLSVLADHVAALHPGARLIARWVSAEQVVYVARAGRHVQHDVRRAQRIRLEVRIEQDARAAEATGDAVLPMDVRAAEERARRLVDQVVARAEARLDAARIPSGQHRAVLAPDAGGVLIHEILGHALEADVVLAGLSWLAHVDPRGTIAPRELVIVDDPRRGRAAWQVDDEGERARATPLLLHGRLAGQLHDRRSAQQNGATCTGHGRRASYRDPVRPRMGCTFTAAGRLEPAEVMAGIERGIYIRRMESAQTDARSGRAIFHVVDADLIEHGRPTRPVLPHLVAVDARATLAAIDRIGTDLTFDGCVGSCIRDGQPLPSSVGAPTMRIGLLTVMS